MFWAESIGNNNNKVKFYATLMVLICNYFQWVTSSVFSKINWISFPCELKNCKKVHLFCLLIAIIVMIWFTNRKKLLKTVFIPNTNPCQKPVIWLLYFWEMTWSIRKTILPLIVILIQNSTNQFTNSAHQNLGDSFLSIFQHG